MKILTIVGARPQFIKAATVSRAMKNHSTLKEVILHTGQHYDNNMSEVFFKEMDIPEPAFNLAVKSSLQGEMTGKMIEGIESVILNEKPDAVLVYGDTNSTLAGAVAASKLFVKLIHVEAGLRSYNMNMPEEVNRVITDRVSDLLCCPNDNAIRNLKAEGYDKLKCNFIKTGDVMLDAAMYYSDMSAEKSSIMKELKKQDFILATIHRVENTDDPQQLTAIINAFNEIHKKKAIVLPLHPRTKKNIEVLGLQMHFNVIPPQGYFDMLELLKNCKLVITDSGGLQKEAYFFKKACVTVRHETEWTELIDAGCNVLSGTGKSEIIASVEKMLNYQFTSTGNLYGSGNAAEEILKGIEKYL